MFEITPETLFEEIKETKKGGRPFKNRRPSILDRVKTLEKEVALLKSAGSLIVRSDHVEVEEHRDPEWIPWTPSKKPPDVKGNKKVSVLLRSGETFGKDEAKPVDQFTWREAGPRTIIAYMVV